ncbi:MAG: phosphoribosylglycinamide formyltransferase [Ignavibacteria bacterium]
MLNLAVFVSGRGSNLKAVIEAIENRKLRATIKAVFTDKAGCGASDIAIDHSIPVYNISESEKMEHYKFDRLAIFLKSFSIELIVLSGFVKKIPDKIVEKYQNKIINIHPALLPSFGGAGMYGINVHKAVFNSSAKVSGATVHFVDKVYDNGKIIAQRAVDISDVNSPEEIAEKVLELEHSLLPFVIEKISQNKVVIKDNRVIVL